MELLFCVENLLRAWLPCIPARFSVAGAALCAPLARQAPYFVHLELLLLAWHNRRFDCSGEAAARWVAWVAARFCGADVALCAWSCFGPRFSAHATQLTHRVTQRTLLNSHISPCATYTPQLI